MILRLLTKKSAFKALVLLACLVITVCASEGASIPKAGDIIFQSTKSPQSLAIKLATKSRYTHCGLILEKDGRLQVLEAVGPVKWTPLNAWIKHGERGHYLLMRLKNDKILTPQIVAAMQADASNYLGKPFSNGCEKISTASKKLSVDCYGQFRTL